MQMTRVLNVNRREARRDLSELANMRRKLESTTQEAAAKADLAKRVMRENNELRWEPFTIIGYFLSNGAFCSASDMSTFSEELHCVFDNSLTNQ